MRLSVRKEINEDYWSLRPESGNLIANFLENNHLAPDSDFYRFLNAISAV
jgi:hypothetical protein